MSPFRVVDDDRRNSGQGVFPCGENNRVQRKPSTSQKRAGNLVVLYPLRASDCGQGLDSDTVMETAENRETKACAPPNKSRKTHAATTKHFTKPDI